MTIGDLFDLLQEKLHTGEFSRMDSVEVVGQQQSYFETYPIQDVVKVGACIVWAEIEGYIGESLAIGSGSEDDDAIDELNGEIDGLKEDIEDLRDVIEEADEYLDTNRLTNIAHGSSLHLKFKGILRETAND
jgi:hypothetical protein